MKRKSKKRKAIAIISAFGGAAVFLLTTGWTGLALANWWSIPVGILALLTSGVLLTKKNQEEDQEDTQV